MARPSVTIVVPFGGPPSQLPDLARRLAAVELREGDEALIVDNGRPPSPPAVLDGVRSVAAAETASPAYARNAGAQEAGGDWLVFVDADTEPAAGFVDAYFDPLPGERVAILAGAIQDHPEGDGLAARLARATGAMTQEASLGNDFLPYALTANCAIRRAAFEAAGGFESEARAGEDADLCWRLQREDWQLEERPGALVLHRNRSSLGALWRQRFRHGAGAAWLDRRYPGSMRSWGLPALVRDSGLRLATGARERARGERGEAALAAALVSSWWAFELGRRIGSNEPPRAASREAR